MPCHKPKLPGHICTGPVAVSGAKAGQVLEVRIKDIGLHYDWGYNYSAPLKGALPDDFPETPPHAHPARPRADDRPAALGPGAAAAAVLRRDGGGAAGALGHRSRPCRRAATAAISTTRSWSPERRSISRSTSTGRCSRSATGTACRATARSASPRSRPGSSAPSSSSCATTWRSTGRWPRRRRTS